MAERRQEYYKMRQELHSKVISGIDFTRKMSDEAILEIIDHEVIQYAAEAPIRLEEMQAVREDVYHAIRQLDVLQDLIEDPEITEIMVNGPDHIYIEKEGRIYPLDTRFSSAEKLNDVIQIIVSGCNRTVNQAAPIVDARLPTGERVNVVMPPAALNGPILTIRRFPERPFTLQDLIRLGSINEECAMFLKTLVQAGYNIFISGGTGSGKTTFLNALSGGIPKSQRVITIEDNAELQIRHIPNLVRLEARDAGPDGLEPVSIRDLIRTSLRMRPDRIIVGEVRGPEALDMIQAMNTGHDGSMSTGHANSARDALARIETMILMGNIELPLPAVRSQIASGTDILVHLGRLRDGTRKVLEISEMEGLLEGEYVLRQLYRFAEESESEGKIKGRWIRENPLAGTQKLELAGVSLTAV